MTDSLALTMVDCGAMGGRDSKTVLGKGVGNLDGQGRALVNQYDLVKAGMCHGHLLPPPDPRAEPPRNESLDDEIRQQVSLTGLRTEERSPWLV